MASPTVAANAYANLARILDTGGAGKGSESGGPSFGALLKDAIGSVLDAGKKSDAPANPPAPRSPGSSRAAACSCSRSSLPARPRRLPE